MTMEEAIKWLIKPTVTSTEVSPTKAKELEAYNMAIEALKAKPQTDLISRADAVQGEWVRKEREYNDCDGHYAYYWYECSVCGARPPKDQWKNEWHSNYCPSCGARMKGGDDE